MRFVRVLSVMVLVVSACTAGVPGATAPSTTPSTTPATVSTVPPSIDSPDETPPSSEVPPMSARDAFRVMGGDLTDLTPDQIAEAGRLTGGFQPGFSLPTWFEEGEPAQRDAVVQVLSLPTPRNAQILVGMSMGRPRPSFQWIEAWTLNRQRQIEELRDGVLSEVFGDRADLALSLMRRHILTNLTVDRPVWYDVSSVISRIEGDIIGSTFNGQVQVTSDKGVPSISTIEAVRTEWGWDVVGAEWPVPLSSDEPPTCSWSEEDAPTGPNEQAVPVLFACTDVPDRVSPSARVFRVMVADMNPVEASLRGLLGGPTDAESAAGLQSAFSDQTADALRSVATSDGDVVVDFNDDIKVGNANTSTGSIYFVGELLANVFQHPEVASVEFRINSSCEEWSGFFQSSGCSVTSRSRWELDVIRWDRIFLDPFLLTPAPDRFDRATLEWDQPPMVGGGGANGSGCAPGQPALPDGLWFGFVEERTADGIIFDLACFWGGARANWLALGFGETDVPVSNDYLITKTSDRLRTIPVRPDVAVIPVDSKFGQEGDVIFADWPLEESDNPLGCEIEPEGSWCLVWLYVNDGRVTEIAEQYVP